MIRDLVLIIATIGIWVSLDLIGDAAVDWWERAHPPPPPICACCGKPVTEHEEPRP